MKRKYYFSQIRKYYDEAVVIVDGEYILKKLCHSYVERSRWFNKLPCKVLAEQVAKNADSFRTLNQGLAQITLAVDNEFTYLLQVFFSCHPCYIVRLDESAQRQISPEPYSFFGDVKIISGKAKTILTNYLNDSHRVYGLTGFSEIAGRYPGIVESTIGLMMESLYPESYAKCLKVESLLANIETIPDKYKVSFFKKLFAMLSSDKPWSTFASSLLECHIKAVPTVLIDSAALLLCERRYFSASYPETALKQIMIFLSVEMRSCIVDTLLNNLDKFLDKVVGEKSFHWKEKFYDAWLKCAETLILLFPLIQDSQKEKTITALIKCSFTINQYMQYETKLLVEQFKISASHMSSEFNRQTIRTVMEYLIEKCIHENIFTAVLGMLSYAALEPTDVLYQQVMNFEKNIHKSNWVLRISIAELRAPAVSSVVQPLLPANNNDNHILLNLAIKEDQEKIQQAFIDIIAGAGWHADEQAMKKFANLTHQIPEKQMSYFLYCFLPKQLDAVISSKGYLACVQSSMEVCRERQVKWEQTHAIAFHLEGVVDLARISMSYL
jgi:hypothetical protein